MVVMIISISQKRKEEEKGHEAIPKVAHMERMEIWTSDFESHKSDFNH